MGSQRSVSAAELGSLEMLLYRSTVAIANSTSVQVLTASGVKVLLDSTTLSNDKLGRWSAYDSGSGSADSLKWDGGDSIDTFVTVSGACKHNGTDGKPVYARALCYVSGVLQGNGHYYPSAQSSNQSVASASHKFPVTFAPGDYIYYSAQYITSGSTASTSARLEANLFSIIVEERP